MRKNLILLAVVLFTTSVYGQTILDKMIDHTKKGGLKHIKDAKFELQQDGMGSAVVTLSSGSYKVFAMGGFSEVKDIDLYIYDEETDELLAKENHEAEGITIVNFTLNEPTKVWIKVYNKKSSPSSEHYDCYLLVTKQ